jgi:peptidoglycan/xylan/chitin deacetylase (PgdA/CDA1 family)
MRFYRPPKFLTWMSSSLIWRGSIEKKEIHLTFDDGPHPTVTPLVLDILDRHNAKAVFFCVGENIRKFPEVTKQILRSGHKIGNHTFNHLKGWNTSDDVYYQNIEVCDTEIEQILCEWNIENKKSNSAIPEMVSSNLFRPPYGRITPAQIKEVSQKFHPPKKIIMWDILTFDYDKYLDWKNALYYIIKKTRNGSIVLFHDSKKAEIQLFHMLETYIVSMKQKGYTFTNSID